MMFQEIAPGFVPVGLSPLDDGCKDSLRIPNRDLGSWMAGEYLVGGLLDGDVARHGRFG